VICSVNRRRSCPRRRGHASPAKADAGARSIRCASCHESAESPLDPLRCSPQNSPSAYALKRNLARAQRLAAGRAVPDVRQQAHQPRHPQREIRQRHPRLPLRLWSSASSTCQHTGQQPEDRLLGIVLGQRLVQHLGKKAQHRHARLVHRGRQRRAHNLQLIEPHQFLPGPLGKPGPRHRHRLQRSAKPLAALQRRLGHALHPAVIARKKAHDQVGLMHRPGAQNHGF
jgi:hypothetical protein